MKLLIIGIIIFLVIMYVYTYVKYKKRKNSHISAVEDFHRKYHKERSDKVPDLDDNFTTYKTKYNSNLDYIGRKQLVEECQDMQKPKETKKFGKLQF